jgi:hypothetical protein
MGATPMPSWRKCSTSEQPQQHGNRLGCADHAATVGRVGFSWQRSHGGLRSTEFTEDIEIAQYDRSSVTTISHQRWCDRLAPRVDVFASYVTM